MIRNVARPPVNPAYKVRRYIQPNVDKRKIDAKWGTEQSAPNSPVNILATIRERIANKFATVEIYYVLDRKNYDVCSFQVPIVGTSVNYLWTADPIKKGIFEEGYYHFYISAGLYWGETQKPLLLRDITNRNSDGWIDVRNNPNATNIKGY